MHYKDHLFQNKNATVQKTAWFDPKKKRKKEAKIEGGKEKKFKI